MKSEEVRKSANRSPESTLWSLAAAGGSQARPLVGPGHQSIQPGAYNRQ